MTIPQPGEHRTTARRSESPPFAPDPFPDPPYIADWRESPDRIRCWSDAEKDLLLGEHLLADIRSILRCGSGKRPPAAISRDAGKLCIDMHSARACISDVVYCEIEEALEKLMDDVVLTTQLLDSSPRKVQFHVGVFEKWKRHLDVLLELFAFLDRGFLLGEPKKSCISEYGQRLFARLLMDKNITRDSDKFTEALTPVLLELKRKSFQDPAEPETNLYQIALNGVKLCEFLDADHKNQFFHRLRRSIELDSHTHTCVGFQQHLDVLINETLFFCAAGMPKRLIRDTICKRITKESLLEFNEAIKRNLPSLLESQNFPYLRVLNLICEMNLESSSESSMGVFRDQWGQYVAKKTKLLIHNGERIPLIASIVDLQATLSHIARKIHVDDLFNYEVRAAIARVLKEHEDYALTQFSSYCDTYMKGKTSKNFEEFEIEAISMFKLLPQRNFAATYARDLSKRMLAGNSFRSVDELAIVNWFSLLGDYAHDLKAMFRDMAKSRSNYTINLLSNRGLEFTALILDKECWPKIPSQGSELLIPKPLDDGLTEFASFYRRGDTRLEGHDLDWTNYALHQIVLRARFETQDKELIVNMLQATVLKQFEAADELEFSSIVERTNLDERLLNRVLSSLSSRKYPILTFDGSVARFNLSFKDNSVSICLLMSEDGEEVTESFS